MTGRPILPAPSPNTESNFSIDIADSEPSRQSRRRGLITPHACTECRKKRVKCDGRKPCGRCIARGVGECHYDGPLHLSKERLCAEIERLQQRQRHTDDVLAALKHPSLRETVLGRLSDGHGVESISKELQRSGTSRVGSGSGSSERITPMAIGGPSATHTIDEPGTSLGDLPDFGSQHFESPSRGNETELEHTYERYHSGASEISSKMDDVRPIGGQLRPWVSKMLKEQIPVDAEDSLGPKQSLWPFGMPTLISANKTWTDVTDDKELVHHLLALYFCWEYPIFAPLSKTHFLRHFQGGLSKYCSSILVNALLALGSSFAIEPLAATTDIGAASSPAHAFAEEFNRLFSKETEQHTLTTIQALGIMAVYETRRGQDSTSRYYSGQSMKLSQEMGLHKTSDPFDADELAVRATTFWGSYALDHAWSLKGCSLPQTSCLAKLAPPPLVNRDVDALVWLPYGTGDSEHKQQQVYAQASNLQSVFAMFCDLSMLVHKSLYVMYAGKAATTELLLATYTQYLEWYDNMPATLKLGENSTPAVLFAHMYYHFAILGLFRSTALHETIESTIQSREICLQAADAIQSLVQVYSQLYSLHVAPSFVTHFILASASMHVLLDSDADAEGDDTMDGVTQTEATDQDSQLNEAVKKSIEQLSSMTRSQPSADRALQKLRRLIGKLKEG